MTQAFATPPHVPLSVVVLRRHAALVRALLQEVERVAPSVDSGGPGEVIAEHLIEELTRLAHWILECAGTMTQASSEPDVDADSERPLFASSSRFKAASPSPATE